MLLPSRSSRLISIRIHGLHLSDIAVEGPGRLLLYLSVPLCFCCLLRILSLLFPRLEDVLFSAPPTYSASVSSSAGTDWGSCGRLCFFFFLSESLCVPRVVKWRERVVFQGLSRAGVLTGDTGR